MNSAAFLGATGRPSFLPLLFTRHAPDGQAGQALTYAMGKPQPMPCCVEEQARQQQEIVSSSEQPIAKQIQRRGHHHDPQNAKRHPHRQGQALSLWFNSFGQNAPVLLTRQLAHP
jgi:hypothetical protein